MNKKAIDLYNDIMHELQNLETLADELKTVKDFDSLIFLINFQVK